MSKKSARNDGTEIKLFNDINQIFYASSDINALINMIITKAMSYIGADGGSLWLINEPKGVIYCSNALGPNSEKLIGETLKPGEGITGWSIENKLPVLVQDVAKDPRWVSKFDQELDTLTTSILTIPLLVREHVSGVLSLINRKNTGGFTLEDQEGLLPFTNLAALALHNALLFENEREHKEQEEILQNISSLLHETLDLDKLLRKIFQQACNLLKAEASSVWLIDDAGKRVNCQIASGGSEEIVNISVGLGEGIVGLVAQTGQSIIVQDAQNDDRVSHMVDSRTGFRTKSLLTVPLIRQGNILGAIQIVNKVDDDEGFDYYDQTLLERLADSAALAIENARLFGRLESSYTSTLNALASALDLRDTETQGHSRRVVEYTTLLAKELRLTEEEIKHIRYGALLHDIGKIGVPDRILLKPGKLDDTEMQEIYKHPWLGYEMLTGIPFLSEAAKIVLAHQENYNGSGYPNQSSANNIPLGARLFTISDAYDAMTSDRPYRNALTHEQAVDEISKHSGTQFDPHLVDVFCKIPKEIWIQTRNTVNEQVKDQRQELKRIAREQLI